MTAHDGNSFTADLDFWARTAASMVRFAALELVGCSRRWSR